MNQGGAGGSVWLTTGELAGSGGIEVNGADSNGDGAGGGGAIAIEYTSLDPSATVLDQLSAHGGLSPNRPERDGGAGTVYVRSAAEEFGQLIVDNTGVSANKRTILPSLGSGVAASGSGGATLVTDRVSAVPGYFVGHWVEIRDGSTGQLKGTWRIASIGVDGVTVVLSSTAGEPVTVAEGDLWQGVYRFDEYTAKGQVQVLSADPIRVYSDQVITGVVETDAIYADRLVVESGGVLKQHPTTSSSPPQGLTIQVRELVVEAGGAIDVSGRGYPGTTTYPGVAPSGYYDGGSHLGEGGVNSPPPAGTFGSVERPQELGGGGRNTSGSGGGVVRIVAERVQIDGTIQAHGSKSNQGGAGGSVWLTTGELAGSGSIEVNGADSNGDGAGGGGAIAIEYTSLDPSATVLDQLSAHGGLSPNRPERDGGAGTVYVRSAAEEFGQLIVDNTGVSANKRTILPSLGSGVATSGSGGATLVTDRVSAVPGYFVGHWVEIRDGSTGQLKGTWRIASIGVDGVTVVLSSTAGEPVTVAEGDLWQGVYRFDEYTAKGQVQVLSADPIRVYSDQVITGVVETDAIYADRLVVESGGVAQAASDDQLEPTAGIDDPGARAGGGGGWCDRRKWSRLSGDDDVPGGGPFGLLRRRQSSRRGRGATARRRRGPSAAWSVRRSWAAAVAIPAVRGVEWCGSWPSGCRSTARFRRMAASRTRAVPAARCG